MKMAAYCSVSRQGLTLCSKVMHECGIMPVERGSGAVRFVDMLLLCSGFLTVWTLFSVV